MHLLRSHVISNTKEIITLIFESEVRPASKMLGFFNFYAMRETMIFYRSFYESLNKLPATTKAEVYDAIFSYGLDFKEPVFNDEIARALFTLIRPQIDANIKRFNNGNKPKIKQKESKIEANNKQKESKIEANNNNNNNNNKNVNINLSINERKQLFYLSLSKFLNEYSENMINDFFNYWSEHGDNDKKMRFEKQTTFGISQRLKTWQRNEKTNFNNPKKINHEQHDKIIEAIRITGKRF